MNIWVDADACPVAIKEVLFRAAQRTRISLTLIANHAMRIPKSTYVKLIRAESGFDVADEMIALRVQSGDLVVTNDIPLAAKVIDKGCVALSPRGELYTKENIGARLNMRDFLDTLRSSGVNTGGPPALNQRDIKSFADNLDSWLAKRPR